MQNLSWGDEQTKMFFELTPDRVMAAVESSTPYRCTGRSQQLGSLENRVYDIEIEVENPKTPSERFRIVKFYRPGRWSKEQILEEHEFLFDLQAQEVPVITPLRFDDGESLKLDPASGIFYCLYPRVGGRAPEDLTPEHFERLGRLIARIHSVGSAKKAEHRIRLNAQSYGTSSWNFLMGSPHFPKELTQEVGDLIARISETCNFGEAHGRIHGDCHLGNILTNQAGYFFLDFDDMVIGPAVQDLWLIVPGRDAWAGEQLGHLLSGYRQMRNFDSKELSYIESLRALRIIHFAAWIAKRWEDPIFPKYFPHFGSEKYWATFVQDLREQLRWIHLNPWTTGNFD